MSIPCTRKYYISKLYNAETFIFHKIEFSRKHFKSIFKIFDYSYKLKTDNWIVNDRICHVFKLLTILPCFSSVLQQLRHSQSLFKFEKSLSARLNEVLHGLHSSTPELVKWKRLCGTSCIGGQTFFKAEIGAAKNHYVPGVGLLRGCKPTLQWMQKLVLSENMIINELNIWNFISKLISLELLPIKL